MIKKFNENFSQQLYLIEEDGGDCLYSRGVYNNVDKFILDMKLSLSTKQGWDIEAITVERNDDEIVLKHEYSYEKFIVYEVSINELLDY